MNNQDVINFLNQIRKILLDDKSWLESTIQPINEAFDMAISAIEKQTLPSAQPEPSKKQKQPESLLRDHCCEYKEQTDKLEDGDELDEAIRHCDEIVQDITWFCNSPSKYIEQRRHESAVKLRQLASWLRELKRLKSEKEKMIDALSEKMCYMNTCPNERDAILRIVGGTTNCENHCNADCNNTNCESYRYGGRDERTD